MPGANKLIIANTAVRHDAGGRFSLNDLHRAAGGENRHRPSLWAENQQTRDLIAEIESGAGIPALVSQARGVNQGTYVCKELVYAYAMWISPAFHLKVIRAYDALMTAPGRSAATANGLAEFRKAKALDMASKTAERICAQFPSLGEPAKQVVFAKIINPIAGAEVLQLPSVAERHYSATEAGERAGISAAMVGRLANEHGIKSAEYGHYVLDKSPHSAKQVETFRYNERGVAKLIELAAKASGDESDSRARPGALACESPRVQ